MQNILEVKNLNVSFGKEKIIENLSFNLKTGENLVILGPNGAGKTVLLKTLLGIYPFSGGIKWKENVKIGYVPQKFMLEKTVPLTVEEFFRFRKISEEEIVNVIESVGIKNKSVLKNKIGEISSGQLQRILIAWALVDNPEVLIFDEPTAGIDIEGEETIYKLLAEIEKERNLTIIMVTHDLSVVYKIADVALCLNRRFSCYGVPQEVLNSENFRKMYGEEIKFYKHEHH
ncbi:ABC transporter ATP-binding protein [Candidatus Wolfebacteria bacterium RBG_13_41_7]|uniref:ABC transporter ATP-binding protein n=1 Tax=Candidatus Wolfebacteria bacterium RBG_13_41_7 TaxID=1802554 RepID=A0A1F8DLB6_9BACT|nr:MAG: ABC transporter ATP-binding protein [Candidatus Wolfebacteria bacterium RBG_13_41_7]